MQTTLSFRDPNETPKKLAVHVQHLAEVAQEALSKGGGTAWSGQKIENYASLARYLGRLEPEDPLSYGLYLVHQALNGNGDGVGKLGPDQGCLLANLASTAGGEDPEPEVTAKELLAVGVSDVFSHRGAKLAAAEKEVKQLCKRLDELSAQLVDQRDQDAELAQTRAVAQKAQAEAKKLQEENEFLRKFHVDGADNPPGGSRRSGGSPKRAKKSTKQRAPRAGTGKPPTEKEVANV